MNIAPHHGGSPGSRFTLCSAPPIWEHVMDTEAVAFFEVVREQLEKMAAALLELERAPDNANRLLAVFRCAHAIRIASRRAGWSLIESLAHDMEEVLDALGGGEILGGSDLVALLTVCCGHARRVLEFFAAGDTPPAQVLMMGTRITARLHSLVPAAALHSRE